jgi:Arc/MetJ-type ribon-helix-helix transcriptional regulator
MDVQLTPDQEVLVQKAIESGRLSREEDAVREALFLWEQRERSRIELLASLDEAEADLAEGRFTDWTNDTLPQLFEELKREARETC